MTVPVSTVTVLTSCTGAKRRANEPVRAEDLYLGQHHVRLMRGVHALRRAGARVDIWIVSARHGVLSGSARIAPYEQTFQGRPAAERRAMAQALDIPRQASRVLAATSDLGIVVLGEEYLEACDLSPELRPGGPTLLFCGVSVALRAAQLQRVTVLPLRTQDTRRFHCGFVGLKGEIAGRLLSLLAADRLTDEDLPSDQLLSILAATDAAPPTSAATLC